MKSSMANSKMYGFCHAKVFWSTKVLRPAPPYKWTWGSSHGEQQQKKPAFDGFGLQWEVVSFDYLEVVTTSQSPVGSKSKLLSIACRLLRVHYFGWWFLVSTVETESYLNHQAVLITLRDKSYLESATPAPHDDFAIESGHRGVLLRVDFTGHAIGSLSHLVNVSLWFIAMLVSTHFYNWIQLIHVKSCYPLVI